MLDLSSTGRPDPRAATTRSAERAPDPRPETRTESEGEAPRWPVAPPLLLGEPLADLPEEEAAGFAALRLAWEARLEPIDEAEQCLSDTFACAAWRRRRLDAVDERILRALAQGRAPADMPSLSTLIRYRARLAKDAQELRAELKWLRQLRPFDVPAWALSHASQQWKAAVREKLVAIRRAAPWPPAASAAAGSGPVAACADPPPAVKSEPPTRPARSEPAEPTLARGNAAPAAATASPEPASARPEVPQAETTAEPGRASGVPPTPSRPARAASGPIASAPRRPTFGAAPSSVVHAPPESPVEPAATASPTFPIGARRVASG